MSTILPPTTPTQVPDALRARWMSRTDGCPECVYNTETPRHVHAEDDGFRAYYRCSDCRHGWSTAWAVDA